jgi:molybdate transport system substrate-binding protein
MQSSAFSAQPPAPLLIAAAADLAPLEKELRDAFVKTGGGAVRFSFGSSGMLARQIENGAPFDVYLSANERFVKDLAEKGKLRPETVAVYGRGRLGLWSKSGKFKELKDLVQPGVLHVALPNPAHAPYGAAARQMLEQRGLWAGIEPRVVYAENVQQAFQYAESGNAEAAITAWSLMKDRGGVALPPEWYPPIRQAGGVVASSPHPEAAKRFLAMLQSPEGRRLLAHFGLD